MASNGIINFKDLNLNLVRPGMMIYGYKTADDFYNKINTKKIDIHRCDTLEDAIVLSNRLATKGDTVLFSPASASFDMFKNFAERGIIFKDFVKEIVK